jgi:hypothetical protein
MPSYQDNPDAKPSLLETPMAAAALVIGSLLFLILVKRGFRGVSAGGVHVGVS